MNRNSTNTNLQAIAARLIVAAASVGGLSVIVGCDQSESAQFASDVVVGQASIGQLTAEADQPVKAVPQLKLASNHNETFLIA